MNEYVLNSLRSCEADGHIRLLKLPSVSETNTISIIRVLVRLSTRLPWLYTHISWEHVVRHMPVRLQGGFCGLLDSGQLPDLFKHISHRLPGLTQHDTPIPTEFVGAWRSGGWIPAGARGFSVLQIIYTGSGSCPASYWLGTMVKWPERDVDHSPLSRAEIQIEYSCTCTLLLSIAGLAYTQQRSRL
jgi:hypothetical protein